MSMIFVANPVDARIVERLGAEHEVVLGYGPNAREWSDVLSNVEAALVRTDKVSRELIDRAQKLRIIARHGVGTDNVDLAAAEEAGIWVTTTPGANGQSVAEHVFALLLTLCRRTAEATAAVSQGHWSERRNEFVGIQLAGKELLLVGGGAIARLVVPIARGFGMTVSVFDPGVDAAEIESFGATPVELDDGLQSCDVVSVHVPLAPGTRHLIDATALDLLKPSSYVINTSRGGVIDEAAALDSLRTGQLAGVGLDVLEAETVDMNDPLAHTASNLSAPNLVVTPHVGGQTAEAFFAVGSLAAESIEECLRGQRPQRALFDVTTKKGN